MGFEWAMGAMGWLPAGIEPHEVNEVVRAGSMPVPMTDPLTGLAALTFWGRTRSGRFLMAVTRHVSGRDYDIVGARELTAAEISEFEAWEAQR